MKKIFGLENPYTKTNIVYGHRSGDVEKWWKQNNNTSDIYCACVGLSYLMKGYTAETIIGQINVDPATLKTYLETGAYPENAVVEKWLKNHICPTLNLWNTRSDDRMCKYNLSEESLDLYGVEFQFWSDD